MCVQGASIISVRWDADKRKIEPRHEMHTMIWSIIYTKRLDFVRKKKKILKKSIFYANCKECKIWKKKMNNMDKINNMDNSTLGKKFAIYEFFFSVKKLIKLWKNRQNIGYIGCKIDFQSNRFLIFKYEI